MTKTNKFFEANAFRHWTNSLESGKKLLNIVSSKGISAEYKLWLSSVIFKINNAGTKKKKIYRWSVGPPPHYLAALGSLCGLISLKNATAPFGS